MPTKLSRYCDGILEALWLTAVIVVPVFFNIYSSRIFEPDKITLLRSIALVMLAVWIIKISDIGINREGIKGILKTPLFFPAIATVVIYLISTIFSVTPFTSLWGSYQRLQGTYTTLSYIVVFFVLVANLRNWEQVDRLISTIIIASLPVSLYGVLQRYRIDPIPWGGDVSARIASNMGNAIFVAAYLIMVFPITLGRIIESFRAILLDRGLLLANFARATAYVFIASLQVIALYFTGSRGPTLGWLTGGFVLILLLALIWRKRSLVVISIITAFLGATFLLVLNIKDGPLENLRNTPAIGRFGQLLDEQSNNARVRNYIWIGAVNLISPHQPLEYPDGSKDIYNPVRPIIGYGPESMYVAYNSFYPPELTQVEKRNASPDRSHNETWDSLVITGILGFLTYLLIFSSFFYYGLKWLGLITNTQQKTIFFFLLFGFGTISGIGFVLWRGLQYIGVGLPFGMVIGLVIYFVYASLREDYFPPTEETGINKTVLLSVLIASIIAHFVEINFGIAIAVTRTYFWLFSGLLLLIGMLLKVEEKELESNRNQVLKLNQTIEIHNPYKRKQSNRRKTTRRASRSKKSFSFPKWTDSIGIAVFIMSVILMTLGFEFISASQGGRNSWEIIWNSLVKLKNIYSGLSYGVFAMIFTSWLIGSIVLVSEEKFITLPSQWLKTLVFTCLGAIFISGIFWFGHAGTLAELASKQPTTMEEVLLQVRRYESLLSNYYIYLVLLVLIGGVAFVLNRFGKLQLTTWRGGASLVVAIIILPMLISSTNIRVIQGDIAFKLAEPFNKQDSWPIAIDIYRHAIDISPSEDYYYLFLGRAYLEQAKALDDQAEREALISKAEDDLKTAQIINPLNTDHTANLARLYSVWSTFLEEQNVRIEKAQLSSEYFSRAIVLSPNNSRIWNEWALLYLNSFNDLQGAYERLSYSHELDPYYDWTKALLAEYYVRYAETNENNQVKQSAIKKAMQYYQEAKLLTTDNNLKLNYTLAIAQLAINTQQYMLAIENLNSAVAIAPTHPDIWLYEQTLAQLYFQLGDKINSLEHAERALLLASGEEQKQMIQNLIGQIQASP